MGSISEELEEKTQQWWINVIVENNLDKKPINCLHERIKNEKFNRKRKHLYWY